MGATRVSGCSATASAAVVEVVSSWRLNESPCCSWSTEKKVTLVCSGTCSSIRPWRGSEPPNAVAKMQLKPSPNPVEVRRRRYVMCA